MKRLSTALAVLLVLVLATSAFAQNRYGWTISASSTDPLANTSAATFGLRTFYLWYNCSTLDGMSAAEFDIVSVTINHVATTPQNGFLNAGGTKNVLLAVGGCPVGPVVAANLLAIDLGGTMCLVPSAANGVKGTVDCNPVPALFSIDWIGLDTLGGAPCGKGEQCPSDAVEETSWGQLKSLYR